MYFSRDALAGGDYNNWYEISTEHNEDNWPLSISVTNDIINGETTVRFFSPTVDLECVYNDVFEPNVDLTMGWNPDPASSNNPDEVEFDSITIGS